MSGDYEAAWEQGKTDYESCWDAEPAAKRRRRKVGCPAPSSSQQPVLVNLSTSVARAQGQRETSEQAAETSYQIKGADPAAVRARLSQAKCQCKTPEKPCHRAINFKALVTLCSLFWSVPDLERGHLIRSLHRTTQLRDDDDLEAEVAALVHEVSRGLSPHQRAQWHLCGKPVAFRCGADCWALPPTQCGMPFMDSQT